MVRKYEGEWFHIMPQVVDEASRRLFQVNNQALDMRNRFQIILDGITAAGLLPHRNTKCLDVYPARRASDEAMLRINPNPQGLYTSELDRLLEYITANPLPPKGE